MNMNLAQALDFLASNCPHVFAPISAELDRLGKANDKLAENISLTQDAVNTIIFDVMAASKETTKEV